MKNIIYTIVILIFFAIEADSVELNVDFDTTRVREVYPVKKSFGEKVADLPGEILKFPVHVLESFTYAITTNPPVSKIFSLINLGDKTRSIIPVIGYSSRSGLKLGFGRQFINQENSESSLKFKWYYSTNDYQSYKLQWHNPNLFSPKFGLNLYYRYIIKTRQNFYGVGNLSLREHEVNYTMENSELKATIPLNLEEKTTVRFFSKYLITNLYDGRDPSLEGNLQVLYNDSALGLESGQLNGIRHVDFGFSLEYDSRNSVSQPSSGIHLLAHYEQLIGVDNSKGRDFSSYTIDIKMYLNLWNKRIIALRGFVKRLETSASNQQPVPIFLASSLGGENSLRGYSGGRFIDNDLAFFSIEYRYPVYQSIDAFLFLDEGRVFKDITNESIFNNFTSSYGFGTRVRSAESVTAVIQIAKSEESTRLYFELGATW